MNISNPGLNQRYVFKHTKWGSIYWIVATSTYISRQKRKTCDLYIASLCQNTSELYFRLVSAFDCV